MFFKIKLCCQYVDCLLWQCSSQNGVITFGRSWLFSDLSTCMNRVQNLIRVHTMVQRWTEFNVHSVLNCVGATQIMTELRSMTNLNSVQAELALAQQVGLKWWIVCVSAPGGAKLLLVEQNQKDSPHSFRDNSSNKPSVGYSAAEYKNTKKQTLNSNW